MKKAVLALLLMTAAFFSEPAMMSSAEAVQVSARAACIEEAQPETEDYFYYEVPEDFQRNGGEMPTELQEFTQDLCEERCISYPLVLAVIERETGYRNITGDGDSSTGYMQVMQKWHEERMEQLGVTDLSIPEQNITVGVDFLVELFDKYGEVEMVLMAYNMGESRAKELWEEGIYSSKYSRYIVEREAQISIEIYGR